MIKIEKGGIYPCDRFRSGASERGRWEIIAVIEEGRYGKNRQEVTIFPASTPSGLYEGCQFRVKDILSVKRKKKQDSFGNWTQIDVGITAELELVEDEINMDGDLPFTMGAYDDSEKDDALDFNTLLNSTSDLDGLL